MSRTLLPPHFSFVLEEGRRHPMDFSLVLLLTRVTENIPSPKGKTLAAMVAQDLHAKEIEEDLKKSIQEDRTIASS